MKYSDSDHNLWKSSETQVFWGEIAPTEHLIQIYDNSEDFLSLLEGFISGGIYNHECIIIIGTTEHLAQLQSRLLKLGYSFHALCDDEQIIVLNAQETLDQFMIDGMPDKILFNKVMKGLIDRAKKRDRQVRAVGEMVALLWEQGSKPATKELEKLWNDFRRSHPFCLLCAYPAQIFANEDPEVIHSICCSHSKRIMGTKDSKSEVIYQEINPEGSTF